MPIYTCPRCGGKEGYTKRIHELHADGFSRAPTGPKAQKFKNVDLVITACKSCGEEMEEEFTPSEIEENNENAVEQTIASSTLGRRIYRIAGYVLGLLSAWVFIILGISIITENRTDFILPMLFWTLVLGMPGIFLVRRNRKTLVAVWMISPGTKASDYRSLLSEFAKDEDQLNTMLGYIETVTPFNTSGLIEPEEARKLGQRLESLGAKVRIG